MQHSFLIKDSDQDQLLSGLSLERPSWPDLFILFLSDTAQKAAEAEDEDNTENSSKAIDPSVEPSDSPTHEQQEQKLVNIIIKDLNGREIKLKVSGILA